MRLPLKFIPQRSQQIAEVVGSAAIALFGAWSFLGFLPQAAPGQAQSFGAWLGDDRVALPFLAISALFLLFGLGWVAVAVTNLLVGSPFRHVIVDRFGIAYHSIRGERRWSWKELGPIHTFHLSRWRTRSNDRRHWIVSSTLAADGDSYRASGRIKNYEMRIPAVPYVGQGLFGIGAAAATETAAAWLEALRRLAREDRLEPDDIPLPPSDFRPPIEIRHA